MGLTSYPYFCMYHKIKTCTFIKSYTIRSVHLLTTNALDRSDMHRTLHYATQNTDFETSKDQNCYFVHMVQGFVNSVISNAKNTFYSQFSIMIFSFMHNSWKGILFLDLRKKAITTRHDCALCKGTS